MMHLTSVLLPAPFSPSSACTLPAASLSETPSSAVNAPKRFVSNDASMASGRASVMRAPPARASCERLDERARARHGAEHAVLHLDHLERGGVVAGVGRAAAVLEEQALVAAIVALAHRRVDADVGRDAREHEVGDALLAQDEVEVRRAERALARLVDDDLAGGGRELGDDLPAGLAAHEDAALGTEIADAHVLVVPGLARAPALVGRQVRQVGAVPLARVDDAKALPAHVLEQPFDGAD